MHIFISFIFYILYFILYVHLHLFLYHPICLSHFFFFFLGIYDNYCVKKEILSIATAISQQILLVDEIIRAGKSMGEEK